ncbi:MAG TPA: hypothetical protein VHR18_13585 [Solirubrobacterales bacterium]|jgi:hypothetical protein|nr:hypothetical protein [Solirubrobacterales bacterium]
MQELLARDGFAALVPEVDERPARAQLRTQVARLELELAGLFAEAFGRVQLDRPEPAPASAPRVLDLGELEQMRDRLADRVAAAREALRRRGHEETASRELLRAMLARPADYKWVRVTREEIGEPGCGNWHSKPRLGPLGMLMGWWQVKVSSGCPLAGRLAAVER